MTSLLGLDDLDLTQPSDDADVHVTHSNSTHGDRGPVAIVGISGRAGEAANLDEFWDMLQRGDEGYRDLSDERRADVDAYLAARGVTTPVAEERYLGGSRLPSVANFDYRFFSLSLHEAKMIDPNQRIFLETAWAALEDAGYLNAGVRGEKVGVYTGLSTDFGDDYRGMLQAITPEAPETSVAGNIKSIIGSRISHLLDFKGPSMMIDTACSSGLVAAYTAYRAIQSGDCTMALAGAVKCDLVPLDADGSSVGIKEIQDTLSADHRTRTFDQHSDGTSTAEGCFVFVLKSLERAQRDGDNIHAVIMGGAVNQDGASNGITAPNAAAQAELIEDALSDAGVRADQVSFIEAHGTATRLGDPIEMSGIDRAFSRQTSRKQFCGIGTVKTNLGHMDNAAGLAGMAKLVMSFKHRTLPASLHFQAPNPNIVFPQTPLYVNDRTVPWTDDAEETLYAGINSFGLSGTNCHLIVRSPDPVPPRDSGSAASQCHVLPLSAPNAAGLARLVQRYRTFLDDHDVDLADLAFTASTGRWHRGVRAAFVFDDHQELRQLLDRFIDDSDTGAETPHSDIHRGSFRQVVDHRDKHGPGDRTETELEELNRQAMSLLDGTDTGRDARRQVAALYVQGADIDWQRATSGQARRITLPTYPFEPSRCWVESGPQGRRGGLIGDAHVLQTLGRDICVCSIGPDNFWELDEHRIHGVAVLPGTGLVEMIVEAAQRVGLSGPGLTLRNIQFASPLAVADGDQAEIHIIFDHQVQTCAVTIAGPQADGSWLTYTTAELVLNHVPAPVERLDVPALKTRMVQDLTDPNVLDQAKGLNLTDRWTGSYQVCSSDSTSNELLYELELPAQYRSEVGDYRLHPALFDALINAPSNAYDEKQLYLPFSYGTLTVHGGLPARVVAHFTKRPESIDGTLYAFDVTVTDPAGHVVLTVDSYYVKSASDLDLSAVGDYGYVQAYRKVAPPGTTVRPREPDGRGTVLLGGHFGDHFDALTQELTRAGYDYLHIPTASDASADDVLAAGGRFTFGILGGLPTAPALSLAENTQRPVDEAVALLAFFSEQKLAFSAGLMVLTRNALAVTGSESVIHPGQAGVLGTMRVAALEYRALGIRCVDTDQHIAAQMLVDEALSTDRAPFLLYRDGQPYEPYMTRDTIDVPHEVAALPSTDGVVLISGGTGDLGTEVTRHLVEHGARKIVLLGSPASERSRDVWSDMAQRLDVFEVVRVDMTDAVSVAKVVAGIRERHGRISGVLHLAGRPGVGFLYTKSVDEFMDVYQPKAMGAIHLHDATLEDDLDYFVSFSSIAGLDLEPGQSDYTAANMVLDSLAQHRAHSRMPALSLQWPAWREVGIAQRMNAVNETDLFPPMDNAEAVNILHALMASHSHPPVIMPGRMAQKTRAASIANSWPPSEAMDSRAVALYGLEEVGEIEHAVAQIWAETLELDEVDAHSHFIELGGNSLLTSQMLRHYDARFPDLMDITDLFRYTTIADQSECVKARLSTADTDVTENLQSGTDHVDDIDQLLDMLAQGKITVEESKGLL